MLNVIAFIIDLSARSSVSVKLSLLEDIAIGKYLNYRYYQIILGKHQIYFYM